MKRLSLKKAILIGLLFITPLLACPGSGVATSKWAAPNPPSSVGYGIDAHKESIRQGKCTPTANGVFSCP